MENHSRKITIPANHKNKEKIKQIEYKLQTIAESKASSCKDEKITNLLNRSNAIERKSMEQLKLIDANIRESKETLKDYERTVEEILQKENYGLKNRNSQINELQKKINDMLAKEIQKTKQAQRRAIANYEQKMEMLNTLMGREIEKRKNYFKDLDLSLSQNLPDLHIQVKSQLEKSNNHLQKLEQEVNETVQNLHDEMQAAQKKHELSFEQFMRMMGEVISEVKQEISSERENRISSKNKIIGLFQEAYAKLVPL